MGWIVELSGHDIVAGQDKTVLFAMGEGIAFTDADYAASGFKLWASATQKIDFDRDGKVKSTSDGGTIEIINVPDDISEAGPLDSLAFWAWKGRTATLYYVPGRTWAARQKMAFGVLEQPVANLVTDSSEGSLVFPLRDPRAELDRPLQTRKFAGSNVPPDGVDGGADLKGQPEPIIYGVVSNIPGRRVNEQKLIWKLADKPVTVLCVRDGGLPYTVGVQRANVASLLANVPQQGCYDYASDISGTYVRLGTKPQRALRFDAQEGASGQRTHAEIWKRIRTERIGTPSGDILASSVTATNAADSNEVGFYWDEEITARAALDEVLASLSGFEVKDENGDWNIAKLVAPSGSPEINLMVLAQSSTLRSIDRPIVDGGLTLVRPQFAPDGTPPYRVNVRWGRNYGLMNDADFLGAVDTSAPRLKDKFKAEWRTEYDADDTIWDPEAGTGLFPNAPELTIDVHYQPGADGQTCPHAATYAAERLALYKSLKPQFQVKYIPALGDMRLPGRVVSLTFAGYGLSGGPLFRVMQAGLRVEDGKPTAELVIGLQT